LKFPDDLPEIIEYRFGGMTIQGKQIPITIRPCFPRRPVRSIGTSGATDAAQVIPQIPYGCTGWKLPHEKTWHTIGSLPSHWLPFLDRERETEMDFRPKVPVSYGQQGLGNR
jgi:hypothetical protein